MSESLANFGKQAAIFTAIAGAGISLFLKDASSEAAQFEKALTTLDIISGRFGVNADKAKIAAQALGKELRIGTGSAAESLQNLFKSGLNLDQATDLLKRFTNEAMTGKSPQISLAQAVQNLSFAYNTQNSALGNMSGVSENFEDIIKKGRDALIAEGKAASEVTDEMAKYRGMIDLTNLTMGSAERFQGSFIDRQAQLAAKILDLKIAIGQALNPVLAQFIGLITDSGLIENIQKIAVEIGPKLVATFQTFANWIKENQEIVIPFLKGLAIGLGALLIIGTITMLIGALTNPLVLLVMGITALYTAWETNFLGIRDITIAVVTEVINLWNNVLKPAIDILVPFIVDAWKKLMIQTKAMWDIITTVIKFALDLIRGIILVVMGMITGDWHMLWEGIKTILSGAWDFIKGIFNAALDFIKGWGGLLKNELTKPFEEAWNKIKELVNKIKDSLDFTKRHSPSVVDIVQSGVKKVNRAMSDLAWSTNITPNIAAATVSNGGQSSSVANIHIDMAGAIIANEQSAREMSEMMGDSIIKKLQSNLRI